MAKIEFEVEYLSFDNNFEINDDGISKVIYGSNGMGKTSVYNAIKISHPQYGYVDYSEMKNDFISGKTKVINITPHAQKYYELNQEKRKNITQLDITDALKRYDINAAGKARAITTKLVEIQKEKRIFDKITISKDNHEELSTISDADVKFLLRNFLGLRGLSDINEDIEVMKEEYVKKILEHITENIDEQCDICPVCDSKVLNLKKIVRDKMNKLKQIKTELLNIFKAENEKFQNDELIYRFAKLMELSLKLTEKEIIDYMLVPEFEKWKEINSVIDEDNEISDRIQKVQNEMIQSYNNLKSLQSEYTSYINKKFDFKANFDDKKYSIKIELERHPKEYSTGEFNLILFTTKIFEFVGSDKKLIVLDDPISSYDMINQYKIAFDIIAANKKEDKNFLIFTHNMSLINLLNSQKRGEFKFKMLDKIEEIIYLYDLNVFAPDSIVNVNAFLSNVTECKNTKFVKLAMERDDNRVDKSIQDKIHKLFHYDDEYKFSLKTHELYETDLTNRDLVQIVNNMKINDFNKSNYSELVIYKIVLMLGLRVWIEKKFYDVLQSDSSYLSKISLSSKIGYALPHGGASRVGSRYPKLERIDLMSRKVMLNQHEHYKSQGEPFYYVMNLSVDDIYSEISEIKKLFEVC